MACSGGFKPPLRLLCTPGKTPSEKGSSEGVALERAALWSDVLPKYVPQHGLQNAAVAVVLHVDGRV